MHTLPTMHHYKVSAVVLVALPSHSGYISVLASRYLCACLAMAQLFTTIFNKHSLIQWIVSHITLDSSIFGLS